MHIRHRDALIEVRTPAKVNLFLEVLRRREDGFHEIETLMVPVDLRDTLRCAAREDGRLAVTCQWTLGSQASARANRADASPIWGDLPAGEENLVYRALQRLREESGVRKGAEIAIWKRIPAAAGLGGASSDAAAALVAANRLWELGWSQDRLMDIAAQAGSDVPFFLVGSAAICRGRGERLETLNGVGRLWIVIVRPPTGLSTADVYRNCRPAFPADRPAGDAGQFHRVETAADGEGSDVRSVSDLREAACRGDAAAVGRRLFNRLQPAAERLSPWITRLRDAFERTTCLGHQMSGSGSSYFGICRHAGHARRVAGRLQAAGLGAVFVTATQGLGPSPRANHIKEERHGDHRGSRQAHGEHR